MGDCMKWLVITAIVLCIVDGIIVLHPNNKATKTDFLFYWLTLIINLVLSLRYFLYIE